MSDDTDFETSFETNRPVRPERLDVVASPPRPDRFRQEAPRKAGRKPRALCAIGADGEQGLASTVLSGRRQQSSLPHLHEARMHFVADPTFCVDADRIG